MVNYQPAVLDATFAALADATRRAILVRLARGDSSVSELAGPFDMSLPAISKHLGILENAGLLVREREGRVRRCRLVIEPMKDAAAWIERQSRFWEIQLDALAGYLGAAQKRKEEQAWPQARAAGRSPRRRSGSRGSSGRRGRRSSRPGPTRKR